MMGGISVPPDLWCRMAATINACDGPKEKTQARALRRGAMWLGCLEERFRLVEASVVDHHLDRAELDTGIDGGTDR
jgi:hypothetical protein